MIKDDIFYINRTGIKREINDNIFMDSFPWNFS